MSNVYESKNMRVTRAGYKYIGHFGWGYPEIILEGGCCGVSLNLKDTAKMYELFRVFDIDSEDGVWLEQLVGKYCRVHFDSEGCVTKLQHLVVDGIVWETVRSNR